MTDRNFDDLVERFRRNIYGGSKGVLRQLILNRDIDDLGLYKHPPKTLLDAGGGFGWMARKFAPLGVHCTVVDISSKMIDYGKSQWRLECNPEVCSEQEIVWKVQSIQETKGVFDMVSCHAVLEWVDQPEQVLDVLTKQVAKGGHLSLMVFNRVALIWKNVLYGKLDKVLEDRMQGFGKSLTPKHAFTIEQVQSWLVERGFTIQRVSGIRVFHDYLEPTIREQLWTDPKKMLDLELR